MTIDVDANGTFTLTEEMFEHMGAQPDDRIWCEKRPDGSVWLGKAGTRKKKVKAATPNSGS